ncbi:MAG: DNA helicase-2/ATP-dependent DNA helicase PcrA [Planctomycetota bacterium]|jgi:DNA helicase-2/ATP-dependent DNA helicase PcrA
MDAQGLLAGADAVGAEPKVADSGADDLLEGLNEPQKQAVVQSEGPLLILAGAGSGKTRAITRRIAWLVRTGRATPQEILAITFTNKAAKEMRSRIEALLPTSGAWIGTFHATCARILRSEIEVLGGWTRDFSIYDTADRNEMLKRIVKDLGYDVQRFRPGLVGAWISDWKTARAQGDDTGSLGGLAGIEGEVLNAVWERYERQMRANNALDFDDLLVRTLEIFDRHPGVRDAYASRFRYVLVDEYQDTNRVQYLLVRHLAHWHGNLNVCGDPDQSIYAWRGADIRNILDFEKDFGDGKKVGIVKLEQNYRSTPYILKAAQGLIKRNSGRRDKDLWTEKDNVDKVQVLHCGDEEDEANAIASRIHGLRDQGVTLDQVAIFYRANFMQRALERGLRLSGVPYQIVGGVEFYQRREIRDLVSYLQLIANPVDDICCRRVLNVPQRGIGEKSLSNLSGWAEDRRVSLLDAARSTEARMLIRGRAKAGLAAFSELMERLLDMREKPASMALEFVIEETGFEAWVAQSKEDNADSRLENIEELLVHARRYDEEEPEGLLRGFLQEIALVSDVDGYDEEGPKVTLMTLHASKGLEFPVVFVTGCEEELLPHGLAVAENGEAGVEEERRLFYVGMTRAEERLFLTHASTRMHFGESSWRKPSRFLDELPKDCVVGVEGATEEDEDEDVVLGAFAPKEADASLREGVAVEHDHFGRGRVARLQGAGVNARVTVNFFSVGTKVLLLQYAKLRVLPG